MQDNELDDLTNKSQFLIYFRKWFFFHQPWSIGRWQWRAQLKTTSHWPLPLSGTQSQIITIIRFCVSYKFVVKFPLRFLSLFRSTSASQLVNQIIWVGPTCTIGPPQKTFKEPSVWFMSKELKKEKYNWFFLLGRGGRGLSESMTSLFGNCYPVQSWERICKRNPGLHTLFTIDSFRTWWRWYEEVQYDISRALLWTWFRWQVGAHFWAPIRQIREATIQDLFQGIKSHVTLLLVSRDLQLSFM